MSEPEPKLLFVYGTLRADVRHPLHRMIRENARDRGAAVFQGRLYDLGVYPGVVDSDEVGDLVRGELYEIIGDADRVFARLDAYEECGPGFSQPTEYVREIRPVRLTGKTSEDRDTEAEHAGTAKSGRRQIEAAPVNAWIYLYNHSLECARHLPNGDYLAK
ncbi:MAG: gamma-glutamylcyclotransferase family protein [Leptospirales bacterium]|jgi:gamma-glutamylcyclotransferase (GGCT)/AIG2-like uncharacterized protein YtfP